MTLKIELTPKYKSFLRFLPFQYSQRRKKKSNLSPLKNFHSRNSPVNWALGPCWRSSSWLFWILLCLKSNLCAFNNILAFLYCQGSVAETKVYDFFEKSSSIRKLLRDSFLGGVKGARSLFVKNNNASWYFAIIKVPTEGRKVMFVVASCTRTLRFEALSEEWKKSYQ